VRGVILVSLENASFHMVHVYTINWFKKVQNINNYCSHAEQPTFNCHKRGGGGRRIMAQLFIIFRMRKVCKQKIRKRGLWDGSTWATA
jgi:hypothetical protein